MTINLKNERNRLHLKQSDVYENIGVGSATYIRWESGKPIPSDKLALLAELGFDVQYVVTGVRSQNLSEVIHKPQHPHFDFEGKLSSIVKILEEVLNELELTLAPKPKGEVIETLLMQAMQQNKIPTKEEIYPILKLVA
jgi:DNA-binding XRE family transcriptional regulator